MASFPDLRPWRGACKRACDLRMDVRASDTALSPRKTRPKQATTKNSGIKSVTISWGMLHRYSPKVR
jgi:hypothetical protein